MELEMGLVLELDHGVEKRLGSMEWARLSVV
jgi:hypothetical protein